MTDNRSSSSKILNAKDALLILTSDANLIAAKKSAKGFEQLAKYSVADSVTHAHPVVMGKSILIKDDGAMALWNIEQLATSFLNYEEPCSCGISPSIQSKGDSHGEIDSFHHEFGSSYNYRRVSLQQNSLFNKHSKCHLYR
jgi:hypothetical protein